MQSFLAPKVFILYSSFKDLCSALKEVRDGKEVKFSMSLLSANYHYSMKIKSSSFAFLVFCGNRDCKTVSYKPFKEYFFAV